MAGQPFEVISQHRCFGGTVGLLSARGGEHRLRRCASAVFTPAQAKSARVPVLYYLAGLTCTEETFMIKAGAQRVAAELGLMLVAPDTSPRGVKLPGDSDSWDFGAGAGFYLDATAEPWSGHYRMYTYVTQELRALIEGHFPAQAQRTGIFGHSMGGHGALTIALRNPGRYRSVSAFAPISAPRRCPWGQKALQRLSGAGSGAVGGLRRRGVGRQGDGWAAKAAHAGGSGACGPVPRGAAAPAPARGGLSQIRAQAHAAAARGLRPRVLLHLQLHGRPPAPSRPATRRVTPFSFVRAA